MRYYYQNISSGEKYMLTSKAGNGVVLSKYSMDDGFPSDDPENKIIAPNDDLAQNYRAFTFTPEVNLSELAEKEIESIVNKVVYQLDNFGLLKELQSVYEFRECEEEYNLCYLLIKHGKIGQSFEDWFEDHMRQETYAMDQDRNVTGHKEALSFVDRIIDEEKISFDKLLNAQKPKG